MIFIFSHVKHDCLYKNLAMTFYLQIMFFFFLYIYKADLFGLHFILDPIKYMPLILRLLGL
jgi:hypothetical protein